MDLLYGILAMFSSICLCVRSKVLSARVHMEGMVDYVLEVYHLWLVCR